jgi:hypothetical protein
VESEEDEVRRTAHAAEAMIPPPSTRLPE